MLCYSQNSLFNKFLMINNNNNYYNNKFIIIRKIVKKIIVVLVIWKLFLIVSKLICLKDKV